MDFPAFPHDLGPLPDRIPGDSRVRPRVLPKQRDSTLVTLTSSSERSRLRWNLTRGPTRRWDRFLLSWPCPPGTPSPVDSHRVHSDPRAANGLVLSGRGFHTPTSRSARVVSHHLDGFLRDGPAGLLRPAAGHEVRRVSGLAAPDDVHPKACLVGNRATVLAAVHPSKGSPRQQPYRITAAVALLPLPLPRSEMLPSRGAVSPR